MKDQCPDAGRPHPVTTVSIACTPSLHGAGRALFDMCACVCVFIFNELYRPPGLRCSLLFDMFVPIVQPKDRYSRWNNRRHHLIFVPHLNPGNTIRLITCCTLWKQHNWTCSALPSPNTQERPLASYAPSCQPYEIIPSNHQNCNLSRTLPSPITSTETPTGRRAVRSPTTHLLQVSVMGENWCR